MYERRKKPCAEFCGMGGWLGHIDHVFKHKPTAVPMENERTPPTRSRLHALFRPVHGIDLYQLPILNSQAHMATQAVIDVATLVAWTLLSNEMVITSSRSSRRIAEPGWRLEPARLGRRGPLTGQHGAGHYRPLWVPCFSQVSWPMAGCRPGTTRRLREARTICPPGALSKASREKV